MEWGAEVLSLTGTAGYGRLYPVVWESGVQSPGYPISPLHFGGRLRLHGRQ